jgi:ABC-2 type transport system permease protein
MFRMLWCFFISEFYMESSYRVAFLFSLSGIFFSVFTFFFVSILIGEQASAYLDPYGGDYFSFVIVGLAFGGYFSLGLGGFARALREAQTTGTLEAMMMTPTPVSIIIIGSALWNYAFTTLRVFIYLLLGAVLLGLRLTGANYLGGLVGLLLSIIAFASIGIISASIIMVIKRGEQITNMFVAFENLIGGVYYPIEIMPEWLQFFSKLVPVTYALRVMRLSLLAGASWPELLPDLLVLAGFTVVLFPLSLVTFRWAVERARLDGTLAHY